MIELNKVFNEPCEVTLGRMVYGDFTNCITSPPYYGLRDYGTAKWESGSADCDHVDYSVMGGQGELSAKQHTNQGTQLRQYKDKCPICGAVRVDEQIGLEETPEAYVARLVSVFREVRRVMKNDGTLWLNLGDSYAGSGRGINENGKQGTNKGTLFTPDGHGKTYGLKPKDLIGIPWMVAFALRADGWYLRQDIIWNKPNPMPESVTDRCTKAHEYIFLLTKSAKYYYDAEAIKEPMASASLSRLSQNTEDQQGSDRVPGKTNGTMKAVGMYVGGKKHKNMEYDGQQPNSFHRTQNENGQEWQSDDGKANKRSVWTVTTKPFKEAHFAVYPEDLITPCVLTTRKDAVIYDPFFGSGTTGVVALRAGRKFIGSELNASYCRIAEKRLSPYLFNLFT